MLEALIVIFNLPETLMFMAGASLATAVIMFIWSTKETVKQRDEPYEKGELAMWYWHQKRLEREAKQREERERHQQTTDLKEGLHNESSELE